MAHHPAYEHTDHAKDEWQMTRTIQMFRNLDGSVNIRVIAASERDDAVSLPKHMSMEEAMKFGRALLCIEDESFGGLVERAANALRASSKISEGD